VVLIALQIERINTGGYAFIFCFSGLLRSKGHNCFHVSVHLLFNV